jgi:type VI secretion system secreted protein VgrG
MSSYTQDKRLLSVSSVLGDDVLLLQSFTGREAISRLFSYQLELLSENDAIAAEDLVGTGVTWVVHGVDKAPRYFNGMVSRMVAGGMSTRDLRAYRVEVVPQLWFLTRTANCKIYQNKSTMDIVKSVLSDFGIRDVQNSTTGTYNPREYCVQYRETAFNFVSRLMEEEGIFYFFRHDNGKHTLVLADANRAFQDCVENSVRFSDGSLAPNHVTSWQHQYEYRSGKWTATDYNFKTPSTSLLASTDTLLPLKSATRYEIFDYPGDYMNTADGRVEVKRRMEEEEACYDVVVGSSECCTFTPGGKFQLDGHDITSEQGKYVITSITHTATDTSYGNTTQGSDYSNSFTCIPDSVAYRPPRITPKPIVQGPQTAVVVGPRGEEIFTDNYGRVKVQFFWDRLGKKDENSSCWVRVVHDWAGKGWGMISIPRIGQEVMVDFLEGDPDRPIITGRVYNADQMPPFPLPDSMVVSGIKSQTHKGAGYNELSFDDTAGNEQITTHAQYDMNTTVEHNTATLVKNDDSTTVNGNRMEKVVQDKNVHVQGSLLSWVEKDMHQNVSGNLIELFQQHHAHVVTGESWHQANRVIIEGISEICLMVGNHCIKIDGQGVAVEGKMVNLNCGNKPSSSAPASGLKLKRPQDPTLPP